MLTPLELALLVPLRPELRAMVPALVADVQAATGKRVRISSGLRSYARQQQLYANRANNPYPVAVPGTSAHEFGGAVDLTIDGGTSDDYSTLCDIAEQKYGLRSGFPEDSVHVQLDETLQQMQTAWSSLEKARITVAGWLVIVGVGVALTLGASERRRARAA